MTRLLIVWLVGFLVTAFGADLPPKVSVEVRRGQPLSLVDYGGAKLDLVVFDENSEKIFFAVTSPGQILPTSEQVADDPMAFAGTGKVYRPEGVLSTGLVTRREVKKEKGIPVPGTLQKLYLLYEGANGFKVWFQDTAATSLNYYRLVVQPVAKSNEPSE